MHGAHKQRNHHQTNNMCIQFKAYKLRTIIIDDGSPLESVIAWNKDME